MSEPVPSRSIFEIFTSLLADATQAGEVRWSMGSEKEVYATTIPGKALIFMGRPVQVAVLLNPFDRWKPFVRVTRLMPCKAGYYTQILFELTSGAEGVMGAIHYSNRKDVEKAMKSLAPRGKLEAPEKVRDKAVMKMVSQMRKM